MLTQSILVLAATCLTSAHFILQWPPTAGFDDDNEPNSPCGGVVVTVNSSSPQVPVGQFAVSILSTHPTAEWSFRGTTDTQEPFNFTDLVPVVNSSGVGTFCLPDLRAPSSWAGRSGVIQVIDNSVDGVLYQCAPVNFVSGSNTTIASGCTNATGFTASWTSQQEFAGESSSNISSSSMTTAGTTTGSSVAPASATTASSSRSSGAAAMVTALGSIAGSVGLLAAGFAF